MRKIELADWNDVSKRVENIVKSLEIIYQVKLRVDVQEIPLGRVYPTEDFLENDKAALVFKKIVEEDYDVPITVVKSRDDFFVLDGHHRAFVRKKLLCKTIRAHVLLFPEGRSYREIIKRPLEELRIKDITSIEDPILKAWQRILFVCEHYEAIYNIAFYFDRRRVKLEQLVPTQSHVGKEQVEAIRKLLVPIVCVCQEDRCYILDGHARSLRAKELKLDSIDTIVLLPSHKITFGIVKTAEEMDLHRLEDIEIMK
jgi:hypothetical protein